MIEVGDASEKILSAISALPSVRAPLAKSAGLVLSERVSAATTSPPWDNSSMDGYAVRSADIVLRKNAASDAPRLKVVATIAAGGFAPRPLGPGEAMRIMTGAPIPVGADSVVRIEDTDRGTDRVKINELRDLQKNIRRAGEDFSEGATLFDAGIEIGAPHLGVLASAGVREVSVHRRPRVGVISSGDELVELDDLTDQVKGLKIVSSNSWTLPALIRDAGAEAIDLGIASDDPASLREKLQMTEGCDLVITSAGVSVGDLDNARSVFAELGGELFFWKVRMRPGAPMAFGMLRGIPWLGFSGNPVSAMVSFEVFGRAVLRKMLGHVSLHRRALSVRLLEPVETAAPLTHFLRVIVTRGGDGVLEARLAGSQSSAVLSAMARANALLVVPAESRSNPAGSMLNALPLNDDLLMTDRFLTQ
ncbi:MAG TPA: gephyrin-like molybdotransferase Glp [Gemmatimonadaceae bacterium]|nr:gephyrin-like molybdotransferase Glp [Gemmatimonadaceae bacterium]